MDQQALREKVALLDHAGLAIVLHDIEGRILFWNRGAKELYGWLPEEAAGNLAHVLLQTQFPEPRERIAAIAQESRRWGGELTQTCRDGRTVVVASQWTLLCDEERSLPALLEINHDITESKRTEEKLRRAVDQLNEAQRLSKTGGWEYDIASDRSTWTDEVYRIHGLSLEQDAPPIPQAIGFYVPEDRERIAAAFARAREAGEPYDLELQFVNAQGNKLWVRTMGRAHWLDGKVVRVSGNIIDITDRKQAEADQQRLEASLSAILESTNEMFWSVDLECRLRTFNHGLKQVLAERHGTQVAVGKTPEELLPPATASAWRSMYERALSGGPLRVEYETTYGQSLDLSLNPIIEHGQRTGVSVFAMNITDRKRAEAALHESEAKFRALVDLVPQLLWMCTSDGMNIYFNQRWVEYTGMSLAESHGRGWNTPFHDDDKQAAWNAWSRAVATGDPYRVESRLRAADGSYRWFLMRGVPLRNAAGDIEKWFGSCTDIDDLKHVEQALREAQQELTLRQRIAEIFLTAPTVDVYCEVQKVILAAMNSKDGMFGYIDEEGALVYPSMTLLRDDYQSQSKTLRFPRETWAGIWGRSLLEKRALYSNQPDHLPVGHTPIERALSVPILFADELIGQFTVANRAIDYAEHDQVRLERIAAYVAPVLRARLQRDRLELARNLAQQRLGELNEALEDRVRQRTAELEASNEQTKRSAEAVARNERFLRTLIEHLVSAVTLIDNTGQCSLANHRFLELFDLPSRSDILNINDRNWGAWQVFDPSGRLLDPDEHPVRKAVLQRTSLRNVLVAMRTPSSGELKWLLVSAGPLFSADGALESIVCTYHEVTDLKRAEQATRASDRLLRDVIDGTPAMIFLKDLEGRFITVNKDLAARLGTTDEQLRGKTDYDLFPRDVADGYRDNDRRVIESGHAALLEEQVELADGYHVFLASKFPLRDPSGRIYGVGAISHDITERKKIEEQNRRLNAELEALVRERGAVIEQLEASNKELESFSYSVSHDLRAPLRAIDGYARIVLDDYSAQLDDEAKKLLGTVRNNTAKLARLVDDLLAFSRLGRTALSLGVIDMAELANAAFLELTTQESRQRVDFQLGSLPLAAGDPNLMKQVWVNLIGNALKFSATRDRALIRVTGERAGAECLYAVSDNGVGFDMRYGAKLFGVFQRLHSAREFEGTGVGLAIAKRIIERHAGRIWAEGETHRGAKFYFALKQAAL